MPGFTSGWPVYLCGPGGVGTKACVLRCWDEGVCPRVLEGEICGEARPWSKKYNNLPLTPGQEATCRANSTDSVFRAIIV